MCKTFRFVVSNIKNIVFLGVSLATVIAFCVTLYSVPPRIDKAESDILEIKKKQEIIEVRFSALEQGVSSLKDDIKEIRNDVKLLLRTK